MPPRSQKPMVGIALIVDIGANNGDSSALEKSKKCASRILERNIFAGSLDQFSVIAAGSEKTDNELNYAHVEVKNKWLTLPNWHMLKSVENLRSSTDVTADWLDALVVAVNLLKNESVGKRFTNLQVTLISNFAAPIESKHQIEDVAQCMKDLRMNLIVISVQDREDQKTDIQKKNEELIESILEELGEKSVEFDYEEAMEELKRPKKVQSNAAAWHVDLRIGANIYIPVTGYKKIAASKPISWKKTAYTKNEPEISTEQEAGASGSNGVEIEDQTGEPEERQVKKPKVVSETVYFRKDEQVEKADIIKGYFFGQTLVPFSDEDKKSLALETEKCLELLYFSKKKCVQRHMFMGDSATYIVPRAGYENAAAAVSALVTAMLKLNRVGIVRRVFRRNSTPQIGALIPVQEDKSLFFYFIPLPFSGDDRKVHLPSQKNVKVSEAQRNAIKNLITAMDLSQLGEDNPYKNLPNPNQLHRFHQIKMRALYPEVKGGFEVCEEVKEMIRPLPQLLAKAADALKEVKAAFELKEVEKKDYRRRATEFFDRSTTAVESTSMEPEEPNLGPGLVGFAQSTVTEVGTIDPVADFLKLSEQGEHFDKLCEQMQTAIKKLVLTSSNSMGSKKAISAVKFLRSQCVEKSPAEYNTFVATLKDDVAERNVEDFWTQVVQERLGLITREEAAEGVSVEEAEGFYEMKKCESQGEVSYEMEAEEMLDLL